MRPLAVLLALTLAGCAARPPRAAAPDPDAPGLTARDAPPVIYEVFVRSLTPEGTLRAATARLDSIAALGADVVWLMPVQPNGDVNRKGRLGSPYAVRDYTAVDPRLGTLDDLRAFVREAHARDLRVILDWVANHTAPDHPWVTAHPTWYTAGPDGARPVPPQGTDWFDTADLDYANPDLRAAMTAEMAFWLREADVDGFRCDVAGMVPEAFWTDALARLRALRPGLLLLAEADEPWTGRAGFDASYSWRTYGALKTAWETGDGTAFVAAALAEQDAPPARWPMHFVTNHDETSWDAAAVERWHGVQGMRAAMAASYGLGGAMLIYNGQEAAAPQRLNLFESETVSFTGPNLRPDIARWDALRAAHPALAGGRTAALDVPGAIAYTRTLGTDRAVVVVNPSQEPRTLTLPPDALGLADAFGAGPATARLALPGYGVRVFVR